MLVAGVLEKTESFDAVVGGMFCRCCVRSGGCIELLEDSILLILCLAVLPVIGNEGLTSSAVIVGHLTSFLTVSDSCTVLLLRCRHTYNCYMF